MRLPHLHRPRLRLPRSLSRRSETAPPAPTRARARARARRPTQASRSTRARRPVVHRRTPGTVSPTAVADARRRTGVTSRAIVLAIAFCAVLLTLAVPLQQYVAQRGQLSALEEQERAAKQRVAALEQAQKQWHDPAYIKQQARERLHFVKPGETAYVIVDPTPSPVPTAVAAPAPQASTIPVKG